METKPLNPIRSRRHMRARFTYAGKADAKTHRDLSSIDVDYHGPAKSPAEMVVLSRKYEQETLGQRQRPTEIVAYEIILSTPPGVFLDRTEEDIFLAPVIRTLKAVAYAIGRHRHKDGRTDFHLDVLNRSDSGGSLALSLVSPKTGRKNRNLKRVMRAAADVGHDALNEYRLRIGKPWIPTMSEVIDKRILERRERKEREKQILAEMDSANDVGPTEDGLHPDDIRTTELAPLPPWEAITAELHCQTQSPKSASSRWLVISDSRITLVPALVQALTGDASEEADELRQTLRLKNEILAERERENTRHADHDRGGHGTDLCFS